MTYRFCCKTYFVSCLVPVFERFINTYMRLSRKYSGGLVIIPMDGSGLYCKINFSEQRALQGDKECFSKCEFYLICTT